MRHYHLMDLDHLPGRRLDDLLSAVRTAGFAGVNITYPCKEAALALVDVVSPEASQIGAINTVTFDREGRATGHNTDRIGFHRSFHHYFLSLFLSSYEHDLATTSYDATH